MKRVETEAHPGSPEELVQTIQKLMDEVEAIIANPSEALSGETGQKLNELRERFSGATERLNEKLNGMYRSVRRNVVDGAHKADDTIRSHPYESLAIALGVGVLLGAFLRRSD
jgi:ElaB/YqjD/DUF883 family membrane-anchored ribosome-binding protein